jgi:hypothetical protein
VRQAAGDIVLGVALAAFGAAVLIESRNIPPPVFEAFGAAPVPRAAAVVLIVLGALLAIRAIPAVLRAGGTARAGIDPSVWLRTGATVAILIGHAAAIEYLKLGFVAATVPALMAMFLVLGGLRRRVLLAGAVLAALTPLALLLLFTRVFQIDLP